MERGQGNSRSLDFAKRRVAKARHKGVGDSGSIVTHFSQEAREMGHPQSFECVSILGNGRMGQPAGGELPEAVGSGLRVQGSFDCACGFIRRIRMLRSG